MSVLIKMVMPQNCRECRLVEIVNRHGRERYICIAHLNEITNLKERLDTCPLEELQEPKRGKWIDGKRMGFDGCFVWHRECSVCGYERDDDDPEKDTNFCPNCGAMMERSEE